MRTSLSVGGRSAIAISALALAAGSLALAATASGASSARSTHHVAPLIVKSVKSGKFGTILENSKGRTLYHFTLDTSKKLACLTGCVDAWPPMMLPKGLTHATAGKGVRQSSLGTIRRGSGLQVTYKGEPLYTYSGDSGPGQTHGQGVGGTWFVVKVSSSASTTTTTSAGGYGY